MGVDLTAEALDSLRMRLREIEEQLTAYAPLLAEQRGILNAIAQLEGIGKPGRPIPIWELARDLLERMDQPMSAKQIVDALRSTGTQIGGRTPVEMLRVSLIRKSDVIERMPDGRFQVKHSRDPETVPRIQRAG
jgi:hypothetical protein